MSQQRTLFPSDRAFFSKPSPKLARDTDPETSQLSAAETEREIGDCHATVLIAIGGQPPMTARQIGQECHRLNPAHEPDTYRKRMKELIRDGRIEVCGTVFDETTRRTVQLYRRVK